MHKGCQGEGIMGKPTVGKIRAAVAKLKETQLPDVKGIVVQWAAGASEEFKASMVAEGWLDCTKKSKKCK